VVDVEQPHGEVRQDPAVDDRRLVAPAWCVSVTGSKKNGIDMLIRTASATLNESGSIGASSPCRR